MGNYRNSKSIEIYKRRCEENELLIVGKKEWEELAIKYPRKTVVLVLYLELVGNSSGTQYEYSPSALREKYGISERAFYEAYAILKEEGYIQDFMGRTIFQSSPS